jgi:hypothetical protein
MATLTEAYSDAGYAIRNPRNRWSARKGDGSAVALTVWADESDKRTEPWVVDVRNRSNLAVWRGRQGNKIRIADIPHALEHCGGRVDLILCISVDPKSEPRRGKIARHWHQRIGRLDPRAFDSETGMSRVELHPA